jgi:hypothetical protein
MTEPDAPGQVAFPVLTAQCGDAAHGQAQPEQVLRIEQGKTKTPGNGAGGVKPISQRLLRLFSKKLQQEV